MTPKALNAMQEEIVNCIVQAGLTLHNASNDDDNWTQLWEAISTRGGEDRIITTQLGFENAIEDGTGANTYQIKDGIKSLYFKPLVGGYTASGILEGAETWGDIQTNECVRIIFEGGAYINFAALQGHLEVDTDDCYLEGADIRGDGVIGAAVDSFLLGADRVTFQNCATSNRSSNVNFTGFQGNATYNATSQYSNCRAYTLDTNSNKTCNGFTLCENLNNCKAWDLDCSGNGLVSGFYTCKFLTGCTAEDLESTTGGVYGFGLCDNVSNCRAKQIDTPGFSCSGFKLCNFISGCLAEDMDGNTACAGFSDCTLVSNCAAEDLDSDGGTVYGFSSCTQISACRAWDLASTAGHAIGFINCEDVSGCRASQVDTTGGGNNAYGYNGCDRVAGCSAVNIDSAAATANGFYSCTYLAACYTDEALNAACDFVDTDDAGIAINYSCQQTIWQ